MALSRAQEEEKMGTPMQLRQRALSGYVHVLVVGALLIVWALALAVGGCALPGSSAPVAGPSSAIPLPPNSTFAQMGQSTTAGGQTWIYTVPNTTARHIEAFYNSALPQHGWMQYQASFSALKGGEGVTITAQRPGTELQITAGPGAVQQVTAPSGGVSLAISLVPRGA